MSDIVVRRALPEDIAGSNLVASLTYNNGDPIPEDRLADPNFSTFVAVRGDTVVGRFRTFTMQVTRGEAVLPCYGVAGVATLPSERRSGVGSAMMSFLVHEGQREGVPLGSLYAFRETFYRKFGYESCGHRIKITCPTERLPKVVGTLPIRILSVDDWAELEPCYRKFAHAHSGINLRPNGQEVRVYAEHKRLTIYAAGDPVEAYVAVSHRGDFWSVDHLSEVIWSTKAGYETLLDLLKGIGINKTGFSWNEPSDSPFMARFMDQGVGTQIERLAMFRVNDPPAALRLLKTKESGQFTVAIADNLMPQEWVLTVGFSPNGVEVEIGGEPDFHIDIRQFAQAFMGEPSLATLRSIELVEVRNEEGFAAATRLLTPMPTVCSDFF
jgi:predicted acetyltransferase